MKGLLAYNYMDIDACVLHEVKKKNFLGFINGKILRIIYINWKNSHCAGRCLNSNQLEQKYLVKYVGH